VKIKNDGGPTITVDVVVTAEGSESRVRKVLDDITVEFDTEGNTAVAETHIADKFSSKGNFSIDYTVNIPAEKNLVIDSKFGNVVIHKLTGKGDLDVAYGNLTANELSGPGTKLELSFGKADVQVLADAVVNLSYHKLYLGTGAHCKLNSKYSTMNADKMDQLVLESKYDSFNFGEVNSMEGNSKFTNYKIGKLNKRLILDSGYGTVKVDHIPAGFEVIDVESSYAQISLGIEEGAGYQVEAKCDFCNISYPQDNFKGNRMEENTSKSVNGKVGSGTPGKVTVISKYGNIKLVK